MKRRTCQAQQCANTRVSDRVTQEIIQRVQALPDSVKSRYLKDEFLSKFVSDETDPADIRRQRAINKWLAVERDNEATEDRLILTPGEYNILPRVTLRDFIDHTCDFISSIIGDTPPEEALLGSFSGGASTSRPRAKSQPALKYNGKADITESAMDWVPLLEELAPGWLGWSPLQLTTVAGNVMFTVPKKTDIDRVAAKEPDLNMFIQKGIGSYFRKSLRAAGINLNDQSINRSLAREGSITGQLATLDLSSASDSVTRELVFQLLPVAWFTLLDSVRSRVTIIDGEEHVNSMFSSMGNGFTFELESLLFYALARSTCYFLGTRGVVSVYGDDIICPTGAYPYLTSVLSFFGFSVNTDKSFSDGPFRESCGGHYYDGFDITPFYLRKPISTLTDVIHIANAIRRWSFIPGIGVLDPSLEDLWLYLKSMIPRDLWGGGDTSLITQLVSRDIPEKRLMEETSSKNLPVGSYYHWLNATWDRECVVEGVKTSSASVGRKIYRKRRVRDLSVPRLPSWFLSETS